MKQILPVIMNTSFQRLAVIDDYTSFIWTTRYNTSGDFELCTAVNPANMALFKQDYYVVRDDDENVGIIEDVKIQYNKDLLIVSGRFLDSILARRIIAIQTTVTGKISDCINTLITQNIIDPDITERKIANFTLGTYDFNTQIQAQYTGKNLLETISNLCVTYGLGFKVTLNDDNEFVFQLYQGIDRTYDQQVNPWVIFSEKYTSAFAGTVFFDNIKYKEDVNVGDLCVIENTHWGIYINSRLVEVIESVSESGDYSIVPTFGV